ncbi:S8 family serine peptidase [Thermodesulfobacteriota bacterium]
MKISFKNKLLKSNPFSLCLVFAMLLMLIGRPAAANELQGPLPGQQSIKDIGTANPSLIFGSNPDDYFALNAGLITSQGDLSPPGTPGGVSAAQARTAFGVNGSGIKIGVISDSFDKLGGLGTDITNGDLPVATTVVKDDLASGRSDEGRAMAQIVHDLAPGAEIYFHSAFNNTPGQQSIADAIDALVAQNVDIIVDDVFNLTEPFFQDGVVAQAVDNAYSAGIGYFSSAGNQSDESYEGIFSDSGGGIHDFKTGGGVDQFLNISVPNNRQVRVAVEWDDPYLSVGAPGNALDFDVGLWDFATSTFVSTSLNDQQSGADPWEIVGAVNTSGVDKQYGLVIQHDPADILLDPTGALLKAIKFDSGFIFDDDDTNSPTVVGHAAAEGAQAIAAMRYDGVTGGGPNLDIEWFSSQGGTQILFDTAGNPISDLRNTPQLTATDGVNTTFFGSDYEPDGWPNFFGTSAAAPHAAAVAALMLELAADLGFSLSPDQIYSILQATALDIETAGFDYLSGFGLIDAFGSLDHVAAIPEPGTLILLGSGILALFGYSRRRKNSAG